MGNNTKKAYLEFLELLDGISSGKPAQGVEHLADKSYLTFLHGYSPDVFPKFEFGRSVVSALIESASLKSKRIHRDVAGTRRELASEDEALRSLRAAQFLGKNLISPFFRKTNSFSNRVINETYHLGFSFLDLVCNASADDFIPLDEIFDAKFHAMKIAQDVTRLKEHYSVKGVEEIGDKFDLLAPHIEGINSDYIRPYELVATQRKSPSRKDELTRKIVQDVIGDENSKGEPYRPEVIFPVAHGGSELGANIANAFEDMGHSPIVYPLLYSVKTRRHRMPWTKNDSEFLTRSLEEKDVLITEDWITTGATIRGIIREVEGTYPNETRIATVKRDPVKSTMPALDNHKIYVGELREYDGPPTVEVPAIKS